MVAYQKQMRRESVSAAGLTLIELIFAVGVLAFALGILFSSLITLHSMNQIAEGRTRAAMIMTSVMEDIRGMDFVTLMSYDPNPITFEDANAVVVLEAVANDGSTVELPGAAQEANFPNPVEVRGTVIWTQTRGRAFSLTASTMIGR